ncbi:putative ubiquitin fusion degradation protein (Ufd1) [Aspergillus mulundensis]|uniref:Uncharacterized protein n=1 Tax=Aspergillus mulundensis TaxID=1810919 RepID=A0A3D8QZ54_9EURO|nr:Uncharacterized protein DSM5745_08969 [Aspergillus mulundensis]RDW67103.1 Uncharacterized protein DSM5745_08969 [Aspergillus mulundensis]
MAKEQDQLRWSSQFTVTPSQDTPKLPGDKIILPQSALEQLLSAAPLQEVSSRQPLRQHTNSFDPFNPHTFAAEAQAREHGIHRQQQLPHPLTFRLVNPQNERVMYAGIREFSARESEIALSTFLREALDINDLEKDFEATITVHAKQLPKGTYVRLRPLEAGYDTEDWKALLERHLRDNYTTLTTREVLTVSGVQEGSFRFLVDKVEPEGEGICVVDTDLEVDIVALNEEQARETLQRRLEKASRGPGTTGGTSAGGVLELGSEVTGQVLPGEYADYELRKWVDGNSIEINLEGADVVDVFLLVSPLSARQRNRPRLDEFVFGELSSQTQKQISIAPTNVELDDAEAFPVAIALSPAPCIWDLSCQHVKIASVGFLEEHLYCTRTSAIETTYDAPNATMFIRSDPLSGKIIGTVHMTLHSEMTWLASVNMFQYFTPSNHVAPAGSKQMGSSILLNIGPGETDPDMHDPEVLLSGLTPHELVDGGRTTECHLCNKIVRLRDMKTHLRHHDLKRLSRPTPQICLNQNCGRTLDGRGVQSTIRPGSNTLGLCNICFGPFYVDTYDPDSKVLRRRIERRYLTQLMKGCGKAWCQNEFCKTGKANRPQSPERSASMTAATTILDHVRPLVDAVDLQGKGPHTSPFYFCTDQAGQQRRGLAEMLAVEEDGTAGKKTYDLPWCVAALEAAGGELDKAREWLENCAPARGEAVGVI